MTETTQNTAPTTDATDKTTNFVPAWQIKSDKLKEAVKQGLGKQVVYKSTSTVPCEPVLISEEQKDNAYPLVPEEPIGFIAPQYDWNTGKWIETTNLQQGIDLVAIKQDVADLKANNRTLSQNNKDLKQDQQATSKDVAKYNEKLDKLIQLVTMTSAMVGQIKQNQTQTQASQPAQSATNNGGAE